jgi:hypothetical protein
MFRRCTCRCSSRIASAVTSASGSPPYKVVGSPNADSILTGRIVKDTKRVLIESITDDPRAVEIAMHVRVNWADSRGDLIREPLVLEIPPNLVRIGQSAALIPEAGQSIATAQQEVIEALAEQIVSTMEMPW